MKKMLKLIFAASILLFLSTASAGEAPSTSNYKWWYDQGSGFQTGTILSTQYSAYGTSPCSANVRTRYKLSPSQPQNVDGIKIAVDKEPSSFYYYFNTYYYDHDSGGFWNSNVDDEWCSYIGNDVRRYYAREEGDLTDWDYNCDQWVWTVCYQYSSAGARYERQYQLAS